MAATSCTPPNYCAHTPQLIRAHRPPNRLRSFFFRLEYHVCTRNYRAPIPKSTPRICILFPTSTMALNPPPLKLCDCANFVLNDINKFAKGQGYTVSKFCSKTNNRGRGRRGSAQTSSRGCSSQISLSTALQITAQST